MLHNTSPTTKWHVTHKMFLNKMDSSKQTYDFLKIVNPLYAKFSRGNINIYLHFMSLLQIDMTQVIEILADVRQGPSYST